MYRQFCKVLSGSVQLSMLSKQACLFTALVRRHWASMMLTHACAQHVFDKHVCNFIYDPIPGSYICENAVLFTNCSSRTSADTTPTVYTSLTNSVLVLFESDSDANFRGFVLKYTANIQTTTTTTTMSTSSTTSTTTTSTTPAAPVVIVSNTTQCETGG